MKKIEWELPFKNMHYLNSLTESLAKIPQIILLTAIQDSEGVVDKVNITLRDNYENRDSLILNIGTVIGAHSVGYAARMEQMEEAKADFMETVIGLLHQLKVQKQEKEISKDREQEIDGAPKGEDFIPKENEKPVDLFEKAEKEDVEETDIVDKIEVEEEEKVEEVIKEIVEIKEKASIKPKTKKKDNAFIAKLRVILNNFKK